MIEIHSQYSGLSEGKQIEAIINKHHHAGCAENCKPAVSVVREKLSED